MKRIVTTTILLASVLATSCRTDSTNGEWLPVGDEVMFTGGVPTRTDISETDGNLAVTWRETDEVGIYGIRGENVLGGNYGYSAVPDSDASSCVFRPLSSRHAFSDAAAGDVYYAIYPYDGGAGNDPSKAALSLPPVQTQRAENDLTHLSRYAAMVSSPAVVENAESNVQLNFHGLFAIVEMKLRLDTRSTLERVPLKRLALVSKGSDLAFTDATVDLTSFSEQGVSVSPVSIVSGSRSAELVFEDDTYIPKEYVSFYFVVATGSHPSGDMTLEVTASDNSVNTIELSGDIVFESNRRYSKYVDISLDDFIQAEPFDVTTESLSVKAGTPVNFAFSGLADRIMFYSGEKGHEYVYSEKGRPADVSINFFSLYYNGVQRDCVTLKYSYDFKLEYDGYTVISDESDIKAATWHDVSSDFVLPPYITNIDPEANLITDPYDSGTVDVSDWFSDDNETVTFAFFYHVDKYDANYVDEKTGTVGNGRTWYQLYTFLAQATFDDGSQTTLVELKEGDHTQLEIIHGDSYADEPDSQHCKKNISSGGTTVIRMQATFKAADDRDAYIVTKPITRPCADPDEGLTVKGDSDIQPTGYDYVFDTPGQYRVTFVGTVSTLYGEDKVVREFDLTVTE